MLPHKLEQHSPSIFTLSALLVLPLLDETTGVLQTSTGQYRHSAMRFCRLNAEEGTEKMQNQAGELSLLSHTALPSVPAAPKAPALALLCPTPRDTACILHHWNAGTLGQAWWISFPSTAVCIYGTRSYRTIVRATHCAPLSPGYFRNEADKKEHD